ncbi:PqqD family protein [Reyranella sp.]|uniref:PqqD family protein n=1 Tax=Reyranella sp. TaxID=1929291 RepID=UPI002F93A4AB
MLETSSVLKRSSAQVSCNLDEEIAVLHLQRARYFGLAGVGAHIWLSLERPRSVGEICDSVADHFDVAPASWRSDVLAFLASLQEAGLVEVVD